jgi:hypothetical protein
VSKKEKRKKSTDLPCTCRQVRRPWALRALYLQGAWALWPLCLQGPRALRALC